MWVGVVFDSLVYVAVLVALWVLNFEEDIVEAESASDFRIDVELVALDNRQAVEHEVSVGGVVVADVVHEPNVAGVYVVEEPVGASEDEVGDEHEGEVVGGDEDGVADADVANTLQSLVAVGKMSVVELVARGRMVTGGAQDEVASVEGDESNNADTVYMDFGSLDGVVDYDLDDIVLGEVGVVADDVAAGEASTLEVQFVVDGAVVAVVDP